MPEPPFKVKAIFEYTSPHEDDLHFSNGQIITVTEADDEDWYTGEYIDASGAKQEGIFPRNFVEEYIPVAPARPSRPTARPKKEPDAEAAPPPLVEEHPVQNPEPEQEREIISEPDPVSPKASKAIEEPPAPEAKSSLPKPEPVQHEKKFAPPPASEKPSSFRDRIAAFNKGSAAPPPPPSKPGGLGGSSYMIKKPFVAPPPSRNAYVPPPKPDLPTKIYRREEDPEIAARESQDLENAERAGLVPGPAGDDGEDQPKPTTLKERIALLQKQQAEQASRHTDAAQKKERSKRPMKKRAESIDPGYEGEQLEQVDSADTAGKNSLDLAREEPVATRPLTRRKSSRGPGPRKSFSDGNDADMSGAGDTTEDPEELPVRNKAPVPLSRVSTMPTREPNVGEEESAIEDDEPAEAEDQEEEEDDVDPEVRRKEEIRARMAKMSGGMGMAGMFGMPMPGPPPVKKKKPSVSSEKRRSEDTPREERAAPVPMMGLPGMSLPGMARIPNEESTAEALLTEVPVSESNSGIITSNQHSYDVPDIEEVKPREARGLVRQNTSNAPPVPGGRPAPPPVPTESRPPLPMSPSAGSASDDELSEHSESLQTPIVEAPPPPRRSIQSPMPLASPAQSSKLGEGLVSPRPPNPNRSSYFSSEATPTSPTTPGSAKRSSRVPPIPTLGGAPPQSRAPPPPPPTSPPLSRSSTGDPRDLPTVPSHEQADDEATEYEGDYDTDIALNAHHKDALRTYSKEPSPDDNPVQRSPSFPPPIPGSSAPRAVPPPPPNSAPMNTRSSVDMPRSAPPPAPRGSVDMPRAAPPPPPPPKQPAFDEEEDDDDDEYDPYRYTSPPAISARQPSYKLPLTLPPQPQASLGEDEDDIYGVSPKHVPPPGAYGFDRSVPALPLRDPGLGSSSSRKTPRQSMDFNRVQNTGRRSTEMGRMSMDSGYIANDIDLAEGSLWWASPKGLPPVFQSHKGILFEFEEHTSPRGSSPITVSKNIFVLFQDYSQTIITARFNPRDPSDVKLEQRHELPPKSLRADQLEQASERFGARIIDAVTSKQNTVVGSGAPEALIHELLSPFSDALPPVGMRAYGALIYSNLGNAATQQVDEIRPGDIITLRNAVLKGKHGSMHTKYEKEVGKGDGHVGIVAEWDGTKKKVRAWEQGRESKKCKLESFKLDDLRSGEVKIWRIMPRSWVGWEGKAH